METRWALCLALAVVAVMPAQGRRIPRSMAVSNAADGEHLDSLQNGSGSFGESTKEKSHAGHSKEKCHNRDLMLCGKPALAKLHKEKDMKQRCRVREEFLTCMSKQRTKGCASAAVDAGTGIVEDSPDITMLRAELRKNFHNCVLSYTIPDQSLGL